MPEPIIKVTDLSKSYIINHEGSERYTALRDVVTNKAKKLFSFPKSLRTETATKEEFWALKDLNFEIQQGDRVGIIGRNGAGKSTLLKILSRITEPTKGRIELNGRVASLLEVGTGFHPELTGRENIFLNGAILGMSRAEIKRKFDEIVDFAEVERFLDTPVKRYSSGMYVRLAFAVAAHLEPEILIVDEVLAVGDAQFQKKCLGKMEDVSKNEGRTIIFVSHDLAAVSNLCDIGIVMANGKIQYNGQIKSAIDNYIQIDNSNCEFYLGDRKDRKGTGDLKIMEIELKNEAKEKVIALQTGGNYFIQFHYKNFSDRTLKNVMIAIAFENKLGKKVSHLNNEITNQIFEKILPNSNGSFILNIDRFPFVVGVYNLIVYVEINGIVADWIKNAAIIEVENGDFYNTGKMIPSSEGDFVFDYNFSIA